MASSTKTTKTRKHAPGKLEAVQLAKEKGGLTYDDLNEILPEDASAEEIDEVMVALGDVDIEVVDEFRVDSETQRRQKEKEERQRRAEVRREAAQSRLERADDPVRMYLREMGRVPLLTKDQEVAIAKRIEAAENELTEVLLHTPYTLKEVQMLAARILAGRLSVQQISDTEEPKEQETFVKQLPKLMDQISEMDHCVERQEKRARRSGLSEQSRANIQKRIDVYRARQADIVCLFRLKQKEIAKIARKIKGLKRRISTARDEIDRVEREVGFERAKIHDMGAQVRRSAGAAKRLGVEREAILEADRRLTMAQRKIDQIESDARLDSDSITALIDTIKEKEETVSYTHLTLPTKRIV